MGIKSAARKVSPYVPFLNLLFEQIANSNEYLLAKFGFDTAENEPSKVCPLSAYRSPRYEQSQARRTKMAELSKYSERTF